MRRVPRWACCYCRIAWVRNLPKWKRSSFPQSELLKLLARTFLSITWTHRMRALRIRFGPCSTCRRRRLQTMQAHYIRGADRLPMQQLQRWTLLIRIWTKCLPALQRWTFLLIKRRNLRAMRSRKAPDGPRPDGVRRLRSWSLLEDRLDCLRGVCEGSFF